MTQKVTSVRAVHNQIYRVNYSGSVDTIDTPANVRLPLHPMLEFQTLLNDTHSITCTHCQCRLSHFTISPTLSLLLLLLLFLTLVHGSWLSICISIGQSFFVKKKLSRKNFCFCNKKILLERPSRTKNIKITKMFFL